MKYIKEKQKKNHDIILILDTNEALGEESQGIAKLIWDCSLTDLLDVGELDADQQLKDTFWRGNNWHIDFMLGSPRIRDCIRHQGALEYNKGIISDHRGLFIDLDPLQLFGGNTHDPVAASLRGFTSKTRRRSRSISTISKSI